MAEQRANISKPWSLAVVTDSASDIPPDLIQKFGITVVPFYLEYGGKEFRDGVDITATRVYRLQKEQGAVFKSAAPSPRDFYQVYSRLLKDHEYIISIHISSKLSGLINSARLAHTMLGNDKNIIIYDSQAATMGCGLMAITAARSSARGYSLNQIIGMLDYLKANTTLYGTISTLKHLSQSGRVPAIASRISAMLAIKPMLGIREGTVRMVGISFFRRGSIDTIIRKAVREFAAEEQVIVSIIHSLCLQEATQVKERLSPKLNCLRLFLSQCTPVIGAHTGPGLIGVIITRVDKRMYRLFV